METVPPVAFPPVFVATVMRPPGPVLMPRTVAVPVPPAAALTVIVTAFAAVLVVTIELPAFIRKL